MRCQLRPQGKGGRDPGMRLAGSESVVLVLGGSDTVGVPNNRQWALLIWIAVGLVWALTKPDSRRSLGALLRTLVSPRFVLIVVGYLGMVVLAIWGAELVGLWDSSLISESVTWLFISGWALFASFAKVDSEPDFFVTHVRQIVGLSLVAEFLLDFAVLPFAAEFLLVPFFLLIGVWQAFASRDERLASTVGFANGCLTVTVLFLLGIGVYTLIDGWDSLDWAALSRQAALPIWLTLAVLPYVYLIGISSAYGKVFRRMDWQSSQRWWRRFVARTALITTFGVRPHDLGQLGAPASFGLAHSKSWREAREAIRNQMRQDKQRRAEERQEKERLERYVGVDGVDSDGRRLDQREFDETKAALRWLHTCHQGWWQKQSGYKKSLLDLIGSPSQMHGLDPSNGYEEAVSPDGSSWYGWRRTITGWVFAIGANAPAPNQWTYDGPEPPAGPPGVDPVWGDEPFTNEASPNW